MNNIERQEAALQLIVHTLKDRSGRMDFYRLERELHRSGHTYFEPAFLADRLQQLELAEYTPLQSIKLTQKGWDFTTFYDLRMESNKENETQYLTTENLKLQNENLKHQNSVVEKQSEIDNLTIENLKLQNTQLKRYIIYSVIAFVAGAILTNLKPIWNLIKSLI
ncbi:hypothetical protein C7448_104207 [Tenacibaculum gallaicum]|uniref:Uncharacterized protein n=1 Tax=Tenacibaculum gallaicum TaxID=561505 RepID=A0A3E0HXB6_9FLAO|nr:hypothetical protein [Tenacibaculum gallaicum]REH50595.1 hypothetical protein C7448_104207 [Tenacibaculum gallaicum]